MAENTFTDTDFEKLTALYELRSNMRSFCQNEDDELANSNILTAYEKLISDDVYEKINAAIEEVALKRLVPDDFNYAQFKTSSEKEDKERRRNTKKSKAQNSEIALLRKQISEEIAFQSAKKEEFRGLENAAIEAVSLENDYFNVKVSGRAEPLKLKIYSYKGDKHFSAAGLDDLTASKPKKIGIDNKAYKLLLNSEGREYVLQEYDAPDNAGKKYTPSNYRSLLGLSGNAELSSRQKNELEFLNKLTLSDQTAFIFELRKRKVLLKKYKEIADFVINTKNKIGLLTAQGKLQNMLNENGIKDFVPDMQKQFIRHIQQNKNIWLNFSKNDEENGNQRFSRYEILQNNLISRNSEIFVDVFEGKFEKQADVQAKIKECFSRIRHLSTPALPDGLCAEIAALGIFKEGISGNISQEKLSKMNMLLNELNLNVEFKSLPVVSVPSADITTAAEQTKIDRQKFEELKRTDAYKKEEEDFAAELKKLNMSNPEHSSTHHYLALKYNAFIEPELNDNQFLVKTARKNAWDFDGHDTTHLFDTAGEFLLKNDKGEYSYADFNRLRSRFNNGEELMIQAPVLQIKDMQSGEFKDLLALGENGKSGHYISNDTTRPIIGVPEYCSSGIVQALKVKVEQIASKRALKA